MVTFTPAKLVLDRLAISIKWVVTPLGLQLSAIRFSEPEHTGSRIRIRTAVQLGLLEYAHCPIVSTKTGGSRQLETLL